eukprot:TRINITY_DN2614_c0_g1_i1.p1 TRINITY_DN2614_c0_g1~~TRINITY_DN2614_c0_g1_i1.p1  ORF type:complete len:2071 (-),score=563.44 TRINITY_DN2614_c0_g1_i1:69-6281(-)
MPTSSHYDIRPHKPKPHGHERNMHANGDAARDATRKKSIAAHLKCVPEAFQSSPKLQLAMALSNMQDPAEKDVDVLIESCPVLPSEDVQPSPEQALHYLAMITSTSAQEGLVALGHFLIYTGKYKEKIIALFLKYLDVLVYLKVSPSADSLTLSNVWQFTRLLISQLASTNACLDPHPSLVSQFLDFLQYIIRENIPPLIHGALEALGDTIFPLETDQLNIVVKWLQQVAASAPASVSQPSPTVLLVLRAMAKLCELPTCKTEHIEQFYVQAIRYTEDGSGSASPATLDLETYIAIVRLLVQCGICDKSEAGVMADKVLEFLLALLDASRLQISSTWSNGRLGGGVSAGQVPGPLPDAVLLYQEVLRGMAEIAARYPAKADHIVYSIKDFLLSDTLKDRAISDEAMSSVCAVLKLVMDKRGQDMPRQVINSLFSQLYTSRMLPGTGPADASTMEATRTLVLMLGRITVSLNEPRISEMVVQNIISRISYPPTEIDSLIFEQLTAIALLGHASPANNIMQLMTDFLKKIVNDPNHGLIVNNIPSMLQHLSVHLLDARLRADLFLMLLKLFQQLGKAVRKVAEHNISSPVLKGMGFLLPAIADLLHNDTSISYHTDAVMSKLFRTMWIYCVMFKFATPGVWRSDWLEATRRIAINTPVFAPRSHIYLEVELELDNVTKQGFDKDDFAQMRTRLTSVLPNQSQFVRNLTFAQCAYIHSVLTLETLRARSGTFRAVFSYLEDQSIPYPNVLACLRGVADVVFADFLNHMAAKGGSPQREQELASHTKFLLAHFCHPVEAVRKAADEYITQMVAKFPQILWNKECLRMLLDQLQMVSQAAAARPLDMICASVPSYDHEFELPEDTPARLVLLKLVTDLSSVWLKAGMATAPVETQAMLQEYMLDSQRLGVKHVGVSLAIEIGALNYRPLDEDKPKAAVQQQSFPPCFQSNASAFVSHLELKAMYSGEVRGMLNMVKGGSEDDERSLARMPQHERHPQEKEMHARALQQVERHLARQFQRVVQGFNATRGDIDIAAFSAAMYRACAFLVNHERGHNLHAGLVHMVCWTPVLLFTPETMMVAVSVWEWLLADRADLSLIVMASMLDIWSWTIDERIGMFSDSERPPNPLAIATHAGSGPVGQAPDGRSTPSASASHLPAPNTDSALLSSPLHISASARTSHVPHRLWLGFMEARFVVVRHSHMDQLAVLTKMLHKALVDPLALSVLPGTAGTRYKLLLLCMRFIQGNHIADAMSENLLRERVYLAALSWFYHEPAWYSPDRVVLEEDMRTLVEFCRALLAEKIFDASEKKAPGNPGTPVGATKDRTGTDSVVLGQGALQAPFDGFGSMRFSSDSANVMAASHGSTAGPGTLGASATGSISSHTLTAMRAERPLPELQTAELRKRRNLILLLLGQLMERTVVWNNPLNRIILQIPEAKKFTFEALPKSAKSSWKEYIVTGWKINPRLALYVNNRFPQARAGKIIQELVQHEPRLVLDIPDALGILVTEDAVRASIPELRYLLYWATVSPPKAISLLSKTYQSHPLVIQYAVRVLRSFSPETIIFYLPQLVQALRYDRTGMVETYLASAARNSDLLAHQLIWNSQTYTEPATEDGKLPDDKFAVTVRRLRDRVVREMDARSRAVYKEELDFFDKFTEISGRLIRMEVPQRKAGLEDGLRQVQRDFVASGNIYLPCNPGLLVVSVEVEGCTLLRSAAKVPILVNFKVVNRVAHNLVTEPPRAPTTPTTNGKRDKHEQPKLHNMPPSPVALLIRENRLSRRLSVKSLGARESPAHLSHSSNGLLPQPHFPSYVLSSARTQGVIFKAGDDIRQDMLALQVIDLFKRIFAAAGLDLYLFPYKVIATLPGCGVIEVVPNALSRDALGKKVDGSLYDYFIAKYGPRQSASFQKACKNFIQSMAAYSVVSYILQIKDRHNGNILVDEDGHIIHIDFGFIFDISPGLEMLSFESSSFKLSQEMIDIMGGRPDTEQFTFFMEETVRAFLAARQYMDSIITLVELMLDTNLPCFKDQTLNNLRDRFAPDRSETEAAKFMTQVITKSFGSGATFTRIYDLFQYYDNGIEM